MFKSIFNVFGRDESKPQGSKGKALSISPSTSSNSYDAVGFADITDGLIFSPTFMLSTPSKILRSDGLCVETKDQIPEFLKDQPHGGWMPKLKPKFDLFGDDGKVGASDAYGAKRKDYISYVCTIRDIYTGDGSIFDRMNMIDDYRDKHPKLLYVEAKLLNYYGYSGSLADMLMNVIGCSYDDLVMLRFQDENYLKPIFEINVRIEKSLIIEGYKTAEKVISLTKEQLIELGGVGSKSADKIIAQTQKIKNIVQSLRREGQA